DGRTFKTKLEAELWSIKIDFQAECKKYPTKQEGLSLGWVLKNRRELIVLLKAQSALGVLVMI
ncbi:MAG: hypothetical protein V3V61_00280, partial [Gammaproteobacteria bacterium]